MAHTGPRAAHIGDGCGARGWGPHGAQRGGVAYPCEASPMGVGLVSPTDLDLEERAVGPGWPWVPQSRAHTEPRGRGGSYGAQGCRGSHGALEGEGGAGPHGAGMQAHTGPE